MPLSFSQRVTAAPDVLVRQFGDEAVLLNLKTEVYFGLDSVGARMWTVLQESDSIQSAYDSLLAAYEVEADDLRRDLAEFLDRLADHGLIEVSEAAETEK